MNKIAELHLDLLLQNYEDIISSSYKHKKYLLEEGIVFKFNLDDLVHYYNELPSYYQMFYCHPENTSGNLRELIQSDYYPNYIDKYLVYSHDIMEISVSLDDKLLIKDRIKIHPHNLKSNLLKYYFVLHLNVKGNIIKLIRGADFQIKINLVEESPVRIKMEQSSHILDSDKYLNESFNKNFKYMVHSYPKVIQEATEAKLIDLNEGMNINTQLLPFKDVVSIVSLWEFIYNNRRQENMFKNVSVIYKEIEKQYQLLSKKIQNNKCQNYISSPTKPFFIKWFFVLRLFLNR